MRSIGHLALVLALAPWMVSAAVAPEHVHEADAQHGHALTHRHVEAHAQDQPELEPAQGHVLWLSAQAAVPCVPYHFAAGIVTASPVIDLAPACTTWMLASILDGSPPHGPPRPSAPLRGPPTSRLI